VKNRTGSHILAPQTPTSSLGSQLTPHLPLLRRYARALTGSQHAGDAFVAATLETIIAAPGEFPAGPGDDVRRGLYLTFQRIWSSASDGGIDLPETIDDAEAVARARLAAVAPLSRQVLLLSALEGFATSDIALLIDRSEHDVDALLDEAVTEIDRQTRARVLIIEDEPLIAMDIESVVQDLGHHVTGVAVTRDEAVALAKADAPGLILADIQLADDSSGIDAVIDIVGTGALPVIYITAFPERLLTGERVEPTFLITKPFQHATVRAAISQALFFDRMTVPV
jgi:CheY-like chemotaxis protein/DNA-directed RNA polymerase specialized sigma24 family protein